ncbi:MAG: LytTR family DNA-binding domain-containing protein [Actinomycetaceae bacterium]|nr:LytTR family DNA-binding domain-containing protein [Actinomycetaceae bacterium]
MDFHLEIDPDVPRTQVRVRARYVDEDVARLQAFVTGLDQPHLTRVVGTRGEVARVLQLREIMRFFTSEKKVFAQTKDGDWQVRLRMHELQQGLPAQEFIRINQGEIVNLAAVKRLDLSSSASIGLSLVDGTRCFVSRRSLAAFRRCLGI